MKNHEVLQVSFNSLQDLIRFADQKIMAVLIVISVELTVFFSIIEHLKLSWNMTLIPILNGLFGFCFLGSTIASLFFGVVKVLLPRTSSKEGNKIFSILYPVCFTDYEFEDFSKKCELFDEFAICEDFTHQIYILANILFLKMKNVKRSLIWLSCSFLFLLAYGWIAQLS